MTKTNASTDNVISASNDNTAPAKRKSLKLPNFVATLFAENIKLSDTVDGRPYMAMQGCEMTLPGGAAPVKRTVMVYSEAYDAVAAVIHAGKDVIATLQNMGSTMKVLGIEIDGKMTMFEADKVAIAA